MRKNSSVLTQWYLTTSKTITLRGMCKQYLQKVPGMRWYNLQERLHEENFCLLSWY